MSILSETITKHAEWMDENLGRVECIILCITKARENATIAFQALVNGDDPAAFRESRDAYEREADKRLAREMTTPTELREVKNRLGVS